MAEDRLQSQRFELKYRVSPTTALGIRDFVSSHLVLDEFSRGQPDNSYYNHSIYLDSDDLKLYWDVINGNINRYKLRLRYYDDNPEAPVFFEIKRRSNDSIMKRRGPVRREAVPLLLAGHLPEQHHLLSNKPQHLTALQEFSRLMHDIGATPKVHVAYLREAWVSEQDNSARVTLDRQVRTQPHFSGEITTKMTDYAEPFEPDVILELKFTNRFPTWFRELAEVFGVMQCGCAKYADGVVALGNERLQPAFSPFTQGDLVERFISRRTNGRT
ncbi:MAG TPA: polyphosphate polymerase domain-containing protein [Verrucomicrobiota bacterium]|nr:polyphosphate polymerase domain-containing protein [Verrucomicrobiota bacterium]HRT57031.1 polyphosphate polymerase domain-containing protein [Candidatus Paceibacterota bacterium]